MIQEKRKWTSQNESVINLHTLNNCLTPLSSSPQSKLIIETNYYLPTSDITPIYPSNQSNQLSPEHSLHMNEFPFQQSQQISITVTYFNYSLSSKRSEIIRVNATDCPMSLCYDIKTSVCVECGFQNQPSNCFTSPSDFKVIFEGRKLSPALSFAFQGVTNGSELVIIYNDQLSSTKNIDINSNPQIYNFSQLIAKKFITKGKRESMINHLRQRFDKQWGNKFRDSDLVFEQIKDSIDPTTAYESARISDIKRMRAEENNAIYQKVCQRFQRIEANGFNDNFSSSIKTIVPEKKLEPSSSPLPGLETKRQLLSNFAIMMLNDQSPSSCRDKIFSNELL